MYLIRTRKKGSKKPEVAHLWDGTDTACRMVSTGGIRSRKYYREAATSEGRKVCAMCQAPRLDEQFKAALEREP